MLRIFFLTFFRALLWRESSGYSQGGGKHLWTQGTLTEGDVARSPLFITWVSFLGLYQNRLCPTSLSEMTAERTTGHSRTAFFSPNLSFFPLPPIDFAFAFFLPPQSEESWNDNKCEKGRFFLKCKYSYFLVMHIAYHFGSWFSMSYLFQMEKIWTLLTSFFPVLPSALKTCRRRIYMSSWYLHKARRDITCRKN